MSKQTQGSMTLVGVISGGIAFTAFVALMVIGGFSFSPALFLAVLVGIGAAIVLFRGFHDPVVAPAGGQPAAAPVAAAPEPAPAPASAAPAPAPAAADAPATMEGPRDGGADDLKKIKGVGPKLEAMLNRMGFYHYDQIAGWTASEVAWVDENLEGFKGRVSRDDWVSQASILASGGETEFSRRQG